MKFRTELQISHFPFQILPSSKLFFLGSCFADNLGSFFALHLPKVVTNPFGTLFNPASIATAVNLLLDTKLFPGNFVHNFNNQWISFAHATKFSHSDEHLFYQNIHHELHKSSQDFLQTDLLFITLGTAFVYTFIPKNLIVSNCHKIPNQQFKKSMLSVDEVYNLLATMLHTLFQRLPHIKVIFTISPIRHLADGFHQNQLSKSSLLLAVDRLVDNSSVFYFPAYEILLDDLRDYRFYADDLCHVAPIAIQYIRQKFMDALCSPETIDFIKQSEKNFKQLNHRPLR